MKTVRLMAFLVLVATAFATGTVQGRTSGTWEDYVTYWTAVCDGNGGDGFVSGLVSVHMFATCECDSQSCFEETDENWCSASYDAFSAYCNENFCGTTPNEWTCDTVGGSDASGLCWPCEW